MFNVTNCSSSYRVAIARFHRDLNDKKNVKREAAWRSLKVSVFVFFSLMRFRRWIELAPNCLPIVFQTPPQSFSY